MDLLFRKTNEAISCTAFRWGDCTGIQAPAFTERTPSSPVCRTRDGPKGRNNLLHAPAEFPQKGGRGSQLGDMKQAKQRDIWNILLLGDLSHTPTPPLYGSQG